MWDLRETLDFILTAINLALAPHGAEEVELKTQEDGRICIVLPLMVGGRRREDGRRVIGEHDGDSWREIGAHRIEDEG